MKISSDIKRIYTHFCKDEDKEGPVCCNQDYFTFPTLTYILDK